MSELKSCPFCGGETVVVKQKIKTGFYPSGGTYYVHCKSCMIATQPRNKREAVIEAWNKRVQEGAENEKSL